MATKRTPPRALRLRFARPRHFPGVDYKDPEARRRPWLGDAVDPTDRPQVLALLHRCEPSAAPARLLSASFDDFTRLGGLSGVAEVPLEGWDVLDGQGQVRWQLWLFFADSGALFEAGSTRIVSSVVQNAFDNEGELPDDVRAAFRAAHAQAKKKHPDSALAGYDFD